MRHDHSPSLQDSFFHGTINVDINEFWLQRALNLLEIKLVVWAVLGVIFLGRADVTLNQGVSACSGLISFSTIFTN